MAIINSMGVGRAHKSAGNMTYRTVRGRTIGSQKIMSATTRMPTDAQSEKQKVFGLISIFMAAHASSINQSFDKTKYGSERNYFMKVNYSGLYDALSDVPADATLATIEAAIAAYAEDNPAAIYRVKKAGVPTVYLDGAWDDAANPITGTVFYNGSKLTNGASAVQLVTGETIVITGNNLTGDFVLVTTSSLGDSTTDQPSSAALTEVKMNKFGYSGKIAAVINNQYLVAVKVGGTTLVTLKNEDTPSMG